MIKVMNLDVPIVCAAGNHARSPHRKDIDTLPASLAGKYNPIIVVGSADINGERSDFSQYNDDKISTHALGEDNTCFAESDTPTSGNTGTSSAAALVAGQIAVLLSYYEPPIDMTPGTVPENVRDYIKYNDKAGWDRALGTRMLWNGVTIADNPYFKTCNGLGPEKHWKYVTRQTLNQAITNDFCNKPLDNPSQITGYYNPKTNEDVTITATWVVPRPDPIMFKKETCVQYLLGELTDGCDAVDNPRNWKGGGVATVGGVKYTIAVQADRQDPLQDPEHGTGCDSSWKTTKDSFTVWGHGWLSADKGKALQDKLGSCHLHTNSFSFNYGLGDDGREWTAWFDTKISQRPCVEWAAKEVGAPPGFKCNGFTH
ncbi:hypothetical protein GE09DRAFT_1165447 [Coniochaeta sp. 2T2.1]|nr:hypothetical protein GE09DRAFT_1165447 [Coniochaeta sp. 2T2.1]